MVRNGFQVISMGVLEVVGGVDEAWLGSESVLGDSSIAGVLRRATFPFLGAGPILALPTSTLGSGLRWISARVRVRARLMLRLRLEGVGSGLSYNHTRQESL